MDERDTARAGGKARLSKRWLVASGLCLFAASLFLLRGHADGAFVAAVLGVLAWFFNVRAQLRQKNSHGDTESRREEQKEENKEGLD